MALWGTPDIIEAAAAAGFPTHATAELTTLLPRTPHAYKRTALAAVPAVLVPMLPAVQVLVAIADPEEWPPWRRPGASVFAWSLAAKLACELLTAGRAIPVLRPAGDRAVAHWRIGHAGDHRIAELARQLPPAAHALLRDEGDDLWAPDELLVAFLDAVADTLARTASAPSGGAPASADLAADVVRALHEGQTIVELGSAAELPDELAAWSAPLLGTRGDGGARLCLRLLSPPAPPPTATTDTPPEERWLLEYLLQATDDPSLLLPAAEVWASAGGTVTIAGQRVADAQEALMRGLAEAARLFPPVDVSLSEPRPSALQLDTDGAASLVTDGAATLTAAGLGVLLPAELTRSGRARLRARMRVGTSAAVPGQEANGGFGADELASFRWELAVGDDTITAEEFAELAAYKRPLVRWRGQWVQVDPDALDQLADVIGTSGRLEPASAIAAALTGQATTELGSVDVIADGALAVLIAQLGGTDPPEPRICDIDATLRPYQHRGVAWLQARADIGLGAILADDMGLGKTIQAITLIAGRDGTRPHLVVCPASVVGNWQRELHRFAPTIEVHRHHGNQRLDQVEAFGAGTVAVTTYGTLRRDAELLTAIDWDIVVLDEAQQFKNHATQTAKTVRALPARVKLPMTGTPVENRLAELWAIMDVAVPGLLGRFEPFRRDVATPIERWHDPEATDRLRRLSAPFVLRRVKSDPTIAPDLPDKQEQTVPVSLTREQASLYQAVVDEAFADDLGEGIDRRGRILALLTGLKQVCNHPAQYLGQPGPLAGRSGKLVRTTQILGEVVAAGDRALVFTQYRRMGELLARHLASELALPELPFLHGGTPLRVRDEMVDAFQDDDGAPPLLLISLKAGGTGLNLTRATHVLHYDRWWNPAVEDQATDRAYRIGQTRTVMVHKLVTEGTLEDRIAVMLENKRALADAVVGTGEAWLTELDDDALRDLVTLDARTVTDDVDDTDPELGNVGADTTVAEDQATRRRRFPEPDSVGTGNAARR